MNTSKTTKMPRSEAIKMASKIINIVAEYRGYSPRAIQKEMRHDPPFTFWQRVAVTLIYENTSFNMGDVGEIFGRSHTSACKAKSAVTIARDDVIIDYQIKELERMIKA